MKKTYSGFETSTNKTATSVNQRSGGSFTSTTAGSDALLQFISQLIQGLLLIGNAIVGLVCYIVSLFGITIPDAYGRVFAIVIMLLLVWKVGSSAIKIILALVAVILVLGFLAPMAGLHIGW